MNLLSLGSGSSGNAFLFEHEDVALLFDCGVGARILRKALQDRDLVGRLTGLFLSHEHSDHVRSMKSLFRHTPTTVFATPGTLDAIGHTADVQLLRADARITVGSVEITAVNVSHDAAEPCGFHVRSGRESLALFTDLGIGSASVSDAISASQTVVLEANYCNTMLRTSRYPAQIKRRIRGAAGHLSNDDSAGILVDALTADQRRIWLAHLSTNNNDPDLARGVVSEALNLRGYRLPVNPLPRFEITDLMIDEDQNWQSSLFDE